MQRSSPQLITLCVCVCPVLFPREGNKYSDSENHCLSAIACQSDSVQRTHVRCFSHRKPAEIAVSHLNAVTGSLHIEARRSPMRASYELP